MTSDESTRIASLTTGAIRTSTENVIKQIWAAVEAAEQKAREMRDEAERFVANFEKSTVMLTDNVNAHVIACQAAIDSFQGHETQLINGDVKIAVSLPTEDEVHEKMSRP